MNRLKRAVGLNTRRAGALALAAIMTCNLTFPQTAFAAVRIDETDLAQGENSVGGGTATFVDSILDMAGVTANELFSDEDLSVNFNGDNNIEQVNTAGSAEVELSFTGENEVEEVHASEQSNVTINADGNNEFEEITATDKSNVTINVTGENEFEEISGYDDASITVRGTDCQKKDVIELGEGEEDTALSTERGKLTIDHVTVEVKGKEALIGSLKGDLLVNTSKIAKEDENEYTSITAGGTMTVSESVIDITGTIHSTGAMTIKHSDVKAEAPDPKYDESPYRVSSDTSIKLIDEKNGEVRQGKIGDKTVHYVDTEGNDGKTVDLKADGEPAYYHCKDEASAQVKAAVLPKTGDERTPVWPAAIGIALAAMGHALQTRMRRSEER